MKSHKQQKLNAAQNSVVQILFVGWVLGGTSIATGFSSTLLSFITFRGGQRKQILSIMKRKMIQIFSIATLSLLVFSGCEKEEGPQGVSLQPKVDF